MKNTIRKWQVAVILITVIVLGLSALPTFTQFSSSFTKQIGRETSSTHPHESNGSQNWFQSMGFEPIKLGLDLNGGVLFVLHVDTQKARTEYMQSLYQESKQILRENRIRGVKATLTQEQTVQLILNGTTKTTSTQLMNLMQSRMSDIQISRAEENVILLRQNDLEQKRFEQDLMQQSISTMRTRIESLGITEAITQRQGKNHIRIELPGVKDPEHAKRIIGTTATLDVYPVADPNQPFAQRTFRYENGDSVRVSNKPVFSGSNIKAANSGRDEMGMPLVNLVLDQEGGNKMSAFSKANIGEPMVTVFSEYQKNHQNETTKNSRVINVATIQSQLGNRFSITNMQSPQAAQELAMLLSAGSLKAPVTIVESRTITATLGEKNVSNGFAALALGIGITLVFMALWYKKLGLIANLCLLINLVCLIGLMAWLPGLVLTLPGIAGFVLTVGMAVDTNVLIFERIKEELGRGLSNNAAINSGYKRAFATILDANITTMISALILLAIGNGPVKGFAMTLTLGLITSLFSGVFVARILTQYFSPKLDVGKKETAL